jgi:2-polyprenyl-3-methyl-5-hydroxy-6-metoxy-1,4-benzoquinol methylase
MGSHWFEPIAAHLGSAYLRYSFTKGTEQEISFIVDSLGLTTGDRVLDVGCGPGRHALALAKRGIAVHGVDISQEFVGLATKAAEVAEVGHLATFERLDARQMTFKEEFDAVICLCQGAFGLMHHTDDDQSVLDGFARALKPAGRFALSAFSAYFVVKYHEEATFNVATGVSTEVTKILNPLGESREIELHTGCFTPRELRLMCQKSALDVDEVYSVEPGAYGTAPVSVETPEFLVLGRRW